MKYWYMFYIGECPCCGKNASYKVRMFTQKPEKAEDRYVQLSHQNTYCGCL